MENQVKNSGTVWYIPQPQELIKLFEGLIDQKIREVLASAQEIPNYAIQQDDSPFLSAKEVQQIFNVSRQTINDWRKSELLPSFKIKSRRYFFKEQVQELRKRWTVSGNHPIDSTPKTDQQ